MKKFRTVCALVFVLFVYAMFAHVANACVPFTMVSVPNENDPQWELRPEFSFDSTFESCRYYKTSDGWRLGVCTVFGQMLYKAWACRSPENATEEGVDHTIAILKDGTWHSIYAEYPAIRIYRDNNQEAYAVSIQLIDSAGNLAIENTIYK